MSDRFPINKRGYSIAQVEEFLVHAKAQYQNELASEMNVETIRATRFEVVKNGYSISAVDAAMEKLEDVFAPRELERTMRLIGYEAFVAELNELRDLIESRLKRPKHRRFKRRTWPNRGYNVRQVDALCSLLSEHLTGGSALSVRDVRITVFRSQRGGYAEHQVDAFMDKVVELLQRQQVLNG